jgi:tRNA-specific 2-thiouridylase
MAERVVVAMSGGVDSSVAAALLSEQGYDVTGVTMQLWGKDLCVSSGTKRCCSVRDALDAKAVARQLGIPHETLELVEEFQTKVIDYFVGEYRQGLTPNPCIACNDHLKFGALLRHADTLGARWVATGHYARSGFDATTGRALLRRAADAAKDQSYVLFNLTQEQLARARFPLGEMDKPRVRELARTLGFPTAEKPDSQDICFVQDHDKDGFLRRTLGSEPEPGPITDRDGRVLGTHEGLLGYTIGQREGLGIAVGRPLYVLELDQANNRLVVGGREELLGWSLTAERFNWVSVAPPEGPLRIGAKIRSRHEPAAATLNLEERGTARVAFDAPQPAITPGQAVVCYDGDVVLGGGWIAKVVCAIVGERGTGTGAGMPRKKARAGEGDLERVQPRRRRVLGRGGFHVVGEACLRRPRAGQRPGGGRRLAIPGAGRPGGGQADRGPARPAASRHHHVRGVQPVVPRQYAGPLFLLQAGALSSAEKDRRVSRVSDDLVRRHRG